MKRSDKSRRGRNQEGSPGSHVLFLSQWFDPEPTGKGISFATALANEGFFVTVVTGFPNYPGGKIYPGYRLKGFQIEELPGIRILRVWLLPSHSSSKLGRIANYLSFAVSALIASLLVKKPDLVYAYHPPGLVPFVGGVVGKLRKIPVITDVQDLWPESLEQTTMINSSYIISFLGSMMKKIYKWSSTVIVISNGFRESLVSKGVPPQKIAVIPNWADEPRLGPPVRGQLGPDRRNGFDVFQILYAGNIGPAQGLDTVLEGWQLLNHRDRNMSLTFLGSGIERERHMSVVEARKLDSVHFLPGVEIGRVGDYMCASDVALISLANRELFDITIPSKLQVALYFGMPVIAGVRGDAAEIIRLAKCGFVFEPGNPESFANVVRQMVALSPMERRRKGASGRAYYLKHFSRRRGVASSIAQIDRLLQKNLQGN